MAESQYDLVVIGSGPAGEVGAIRAAQLGLKCAIIEKREHLGGTCLNVGCIPTKALLEAARTKDKLDHLEELGFEAGKVKFHWDKIMARKENIVNQQRKGLRFLMKKNKIDVYEGHGRFKDRNTISITDNSGKETVIKTKNTLLATGSIVRELPFAKSNGKNILTSDSILSIDHIPKTMAVVGGGVVGMEFASVFSRFGSEVVVIELGPQMLPFEDEETVKELTKVYKKIGVKLETNTKLTKLDDDGKKVTLTVEGGEPRKFDKVLMSIGREPVTGDVGFDKIGLQVEKGGFVKVDDHYRTKIPGIFAVGDIIDTPALAHTASAEAMHAVEVIGGHNPPLINYDANPNAVYTYPEIASIGKTEKALKEAKIDYKATKFPFAPMAKAKIDGTADGFIKLLSDPKYGEVLGVHIVNAKATELIAEFALGKVLETTIDEIGSTIHPHPTMSETIMETAHAAIGGAIHM